MDFRGYLQKGFEIVKLNRQAAVEASKDETALMPGVIFVALGSIAWPAGLILSGSKIIGIIGMIGALILLPVSLIGFFAGMGLVHRIARIFGGQASFYEYLRPVALASMVGWAQVIPYIGFFLTLWSLVVNIIVLEDVHKLSTGKAVASLLIGVVGMGVLFLVLIIAPFFLLLGGMFGMAGSQG